MKNTRIAVNMHGVLRGIFAGNFFLHKILEGLSVG